MSIIWDVLAQTFVEIVIVSCFTYVLTLVVFLLMEKYL